MFFKDFDYLQLSWMLYDYFSEDCLLVFAIGSGAV